MSLGRHGRARPGHPRGDEAHKGVDARHKAGHDGFVRCDEFLAEGVR